MDEILKKTLLYDFYGELLTARQQRIYEEVVLNDYSISEIAKDEGTSRQSIHDMIKRCGALLENYEDKLHLVERFVRLRSKADMIRKIACKEGGTDYDNDKRLEEIDLIASEMIEDL